MEQRFTIVQYHKPVYDPNHATMQAGWAGIILFIFIGLIFEIMGRI